MNAWPALRPQLWLRPHRHQRHERHQQRTQTSHGSSIARGERRRLFASFAAAEVEPRFRTDPVKACKTAVQKFFVVVGIFGIATCLQAQQPADPVSPSPQPAATPFIADPTQAEVPRAEAVPTAKPDLSFPTSPIAPPAAQAVTAPPPEPGVARAEPVSEREVITRLQIFLDQRSFSPGKIDGRWGEFVAKALQRYQRANALPASGQIDAACNRSSSIFFPFTRPTS